MILEDYQEDLDRKLLDDLIASLGAEKFNPGLERIKKSFDQKIFNTLNSKKIIIIAGTNGKGQTAFNTASMLENLNISYCLWTSPHLLSLRERFRTNKRFVSLPEVSDLLQNSSSDLKQKKLKLSFYEFLFYAFCQWAYSLEPDVLILEVGLGGRLDAVNIFDSDITALTSISRDHTEYLGNTYKEILGEKLAVARPDAWLFSCLELSFLRSLTKKYAKNLKINYKDIYNDLDANEQSSFSSKNFELSKAVVRKFLDLENLSYSLENQLPSISMGRDQLMTIKGRTIIFIGSHNIDGVRKLVATKGATNLKDLDFLWAAFSQRNHSHLVTMVKMLKNAKLAEHNYITTFDHIRAWGPGDEFALPLRQDWEEWLLSEESVNKKILVTGSYFFLGAVQSFLSKYF